MTVIGHSMTWGEALRLKQQLILDPGSHVAAATLGWQYPLSHEALTLKDVHDATVRAHFKNPALHPRPWPTDGSDKRRRGNAAGRTREEVVAILAAHGHKGAA